ncbi:MAG: multiprotein bridging factor aMBF1 [Methanospirillum sp.]|uniref:multiprotein bridging factor aMBF1 n=1 Tax=Methanospirillum sp. TaxID=45200 RepID=UPI00236D97AE|nr:multiprotein bridging factor aMBF1 [Methanospirillum sp.]MDD1727442.1 multiprotein bridging factor aMBF1 [Methanospirillum sp.]
MQCEMCGADSKVPLKRVRIEGAELSVCSNCARYGTELQGAAKSPAAPAGKQSGYIQAQVPQARRSRDLFDQLGGDLVEDYAERIRNARLKLGLSQKDLALAMMEKELLIKKIEKGELIPEEDVRRKIEKELDIKLIEDSSSESLDIHQSRMTTTMGDVIKIKKVKK